jgi:homoserine dehydrogenase
MRPRSPAAFRSSRSCAKSLAGNRDHAHLHGIVNGTCNYILTRMKLEGAEFADVLADAQRLGYAEAEPSLDVDGHDARAQDRASSPRSLTASG